MRGTRSRWGTRLGRWVGRCGVPSVVRQLRAAGHPISRQAVYGWVSGRHSPRPTVMRTLVELSAGQVRYADLVPTPAPHDRVAAFED